MIDVRGPEHGRFWWAKATGMGRPYFRTVFIAEIDPPYRVGSGFRIGPVCLGWVREWQSDDLRVMGGREMSDVSPEDLNSSMWLPPEAH